MLKIASLLNLLSEAAFCNIALHYCLLGTWLRAFDENCDKFSGLYALYVKLIDDGNISSQYKTMPRMYFFLRISHFPDIKGEYDDESLS